MDKLDIKLWTLASKGQIVPDRSLLKTPEQIEMIKKSAALNTAVLDHVAAHIHAGMSTAEIDKLVYDFTTEHGGIPAPLNYEGFPKSVCTSINNVICHGIPSEHEILIDGDIINVDVSTILNGYFSDASRMFTIGEVSPEAERIVRVTKECVELGLKAAKPWGHLGDIAYAINSHAQENGYSVVEEIGGHGIGLEFHEEPFVSYVTPKGSEMVLVPGMMFTIEPMINQGSPEFYVDEDKKRLPERTVPFPVIFFYLHSTEYTASHAPLHSAFPAPMPNAVPYLQPLRHLPPDIPHTLLYIRLCKNTANVSYDISPESQPPIQELSLPYVRCGY